MAYYPIPKNIDGNIFNKIDYESIKYSEAFLSDISQNTNDIATNTNNIQTTANDVAYNAYNIQTNASDIQTNANNIVLNSINITKTRHMWANTVMTFFESDIVINGEIQSHAFTDADHDAVNKVLAIEDDVKNVTPNIITFSDDTNTYGKIGQGQQSNIFVIETDNTLNNNLYLDTHGGICRIISQTLWLDGNIYIGDEFQNYAYTDQDKTDVTSISTISSDLNLLEISVGQNISRLDALEETKEETKIFIPTFNIGLQLLGISTINSGTVYNATNYFSLSDHYKMSSYVNNSGKWTAGDRNISVKYAFSFKTNGSLIITFKSKIQLYRFGQVHRESPFQGVDYNSGNTTDKYIYHNGELSLSMNDVSNYKIYLYTEYHFAANIGVVNTDFHLDCHISVNEI